MNRPPLQRSSAFWPQAVVGAALALLGLAVLTALFVVIYNDHEPYHTYAIDLGLAGTALISLGGQIAFLVGSWLVWRGTRRDGSFRP